MTDTEIVKLLKEALVHTDPEMKAFARDLTMETSLLQVDSVVIIGVVGFIEERLDGEVSDEALQSISTVGDFVSLVRRIRPTAMEETPLMGG